MTRAWIRTILAFATALAALVVAMPARAAAPLCDDRGAITFAPAPQLQAPTTSIDVGVGSEEEDCLGLHLLRSLHDGRAPSPLGSAPAQDVALPGAIAIAPASHTRMSPPHAEIMRAPQGVRVRVDRPPRY